MMIKITVTEQEIRNAIADYIFKMQTGVEQRPEPNQIVFLVGIGGIGEPYVAPVIAVLETGKL